ncbi:MAG TPA: alanyl-tRNA editing protein [Ruminococcaceae bacterium]|jgi:alanyl-tRNA synthetase|nr:alanyl-tRNA editing protein [Oscillospiraceae bacterium]HBG55429.1 alanyl-tRNA editing protein [Oscillospiraceae bacterium]HBQ46812.1 alanyl-tRNA editing protein [Oscillospiraceae bacterium]HBT91018.1 alanyl-tRNA editing protein [Oscillospiraceae bacterium]HCB91761.1 alanyl-tRNA editing protein [Oscillospiraceae bacterium]
MTEKLYDSNAYLKIFAAHVVGCRRQGKTFAVTLDRTAFYPEGGGQPADTGVLNLANVLDVQESGGEIVHRTDRPLPEGALVFGGIDWTRRFRRMQQHTGEHIVSGVAHRLFGAENVGFHMGEAFLTVDWNVPIGPDGLAAVERLANEAVYRDLPVRAEYPEPDVLKRLRYRSKKELTGPVRIVTVPGYDVCACCGTHVARTGEIGAVKLLSAQNYKGGTRITMACGAQAMEAFGERLRITDALSNLLSAKTEKIEPAAEHILTENEELKRQVSALRGRILEMKAAAVPENGGNACVFEEGLSPDDLRRFALLLAGRCGGTAAVFSGENGRYRYAAAAKNRDVRPFGKALNAAFSGRGGGSAELVQGSVKGEEKAVRAFCRQAARPDP